MGRYRLSLTILASILLLIATIESVASEEYDDARNFVVRHYDAIIQKELLEDSKITYTKEYCNRPWPSIDLYVPVNIVPYHNDMHKNTKDEWYYIFLSTYLQYWPIGISKSKITFVIDEEHANNRSIKAHEEFTAKYHSLLDGYPEAGYQVVTNNFPQTAWVHGRWRQQLVGFYADWHVKSEYVGFMDGDSAFITYVDREDLFENGKPIVRGRFGGGFMNFFTLPAEWLLGGLKEPVKCMSYFPVLIKTEHIKMMREYIEKVHGKSFLRIFREWVDRPEHQGILAHFHPMCVYIWHFHRDEYAWHAYGTTSEIGYYNTTQQVIDSNFTIDMLTPRPNINIHFPYHHFVYTLDEIFFGGVCHGPPFPKADSEMEERCQKLEHAKTDYPLVMNNFEWNDSDNDNPLFSAYVMKYDTIRHRRIEKCDHKYNMSLVQYDILKGFVKKD